MKIAIAKIPPEGLEVYEEFDTNALDLNRPDLKFTSVLKANARLMKIVNVVSVEVAVSSRVLIVCSRCLEEKDKDFVQNYKLNYEIRKEDRFIDLEPDIREEIILSYPVKVLCQSDCQGLCPRCGKNLNQAQCNCSS